MNYIEKLHFNAIDEHESEIIKHSAIYVIDKEKAASKSAEITEQIAIEFSEWLQENRWFSFHNDGRWNYTFEQGTAISDVDYNKN